MYNKIKTNKTGFTLVELIIAIAILLIIMGTMTPLLVNSSRYLTEITARAKCQNAASNIINSIRTQAGNTNYAGIYNTSVDTNADVDTNIESINSAASSSTTYARFYTASDYSAFYRETKDSTSTVVSSNDLDGRLIKVDFECGTSTGASDSRMAMLYVYVSIYDSSQRDEVITYFGNSSNVNNVEYKSDDGTANYADAPEPLYFQKSGIYLINLRENIEVPASVRNILLDAVENGALRLLVDGSESSYNLSDEAYKTVYDEFVEYLKDNDSTSYEALFNSGDVTTYLSGQTTDYIGSCLKYQDISKYEESL